MVELNIYKGQIGEWRNFTGVAIVAISRMNPQNHCPGCSKKDFLPSV
jgi:hypothetical protein